MFIHAGRKSSLLYSEQLFNVKCKSCKQEFIRMDVRGEYVHVYWIPLFTIGKKAVSECEHCKQKLEKKKEMPQTYLEAYEEIKTKAKAPIWHFSGLFLIALISLLTISTIPGSNHKKLLYIRKPLSGDIYYFKTGNKYSTMKVASVVDDTVFVRYNLSTSLSTFRVSSIEKEENYSKDNSPISRDSLLEMYDKKTIYSITREDE